MNYNGTNKWYESIPPPSTYVQQQTLQLEDKLLMIPGPTNIHPLVLQAMSKPIISHTDPQFYKLLREIQDGIRYLFQTNNDYTFALTGSGTCAMECAIRNLLLPGQKLLSLVPGYWGERAASIGERIGAQVYRLKSTSFGQIIDLAQIEETLRTFRPNLMYVCQGDSSLGLLQPLHGIGQLCRQYGCLLLVDAVVSLCTSPLAMDSLQIDILFSAAQKALSGPPGVALISFNQRAVTVFRQQVKNHRQPSSYYMDLELIAKAWGTDNGGNYIYHYTHAINLLYGLRQAIALVVKDGGVAQLVQRHLDVKRHFEMRLQQQLKLQPVIELSQYRLPGIMSVRIPTNVDGKKVIEYLYAKHNIFISGSLLASSMCVPSFWRMGYLGVNADREKIDRLCNALQDALQQQQRPLKSHL